MSPSGIRQVLWNLPSPLLATELQRPGPPPTHVQFSGLPTERDHALLGEFLATQPQATLQLSATDMATDLEFLRHYGRVHRITIALAQVTSFDGLRHLRPDLVALGIGGTHRRRVSLKGPTEDRRDDSSRIGAQRDTNSDLASAPRHDERHDRGIPASEMRRAIALTNKVSRNQNSWNWSSLFMTSFSGVTA